MPPEIALSDEDGTVRLAGTLSAPGATDGDVLTVQADGSVIPAPGGGSQPPIPFVQNADPGAVGEGAIWVLISDFAPEVYVRNETDDGWLQVYPTLPATIAQVLDTGDDAGGEQLNNIGPITGDGSDWDTGGGNLDLSNGSIVDGNSATFGGLVTADGLNVDGAAFGRAAYVDPVSGTFAADLISSLIGAGLMDAAP